jgi:hypothetical protein
VALIASGTPFIGYVSLTPGAPGPVPFAIFLIMGQAAIAMPANLVPYIVNMTLSSNDSVASLVTVDSGGTAPTKFLRAYMSQTQVLQPEQIALGVLRGILGTAPRAAAQAVSAGATVECTIMGYLYNPS